jgi:hypothetical protein
MVEMDKVKLEDFFCKTGRFLHEMLFHSDLFNTETFCYGDVLFRRRCAQETLCYGDILLRRRFVWRRFVEETFCKETFCMCAYSIWPDRLNNLCVMSINCFAGGTPCAY